ncbi:MAG TPA: tetratricopeptide repeat protein [Gemmatimonadaceae bacterium]|nr:tetratricopeptide repeat protein [Gemmatimonadaceae bacterium]
MVAKRKKQVLSRRRRLRPWQIALLVAAAVLVLAWRVLRFALPGHAGADALPPPRETPRPSAVSRADFVGSERCAGCHAAQYATWRRSTHGRAGGTPPTRDLVIAAFDGNPIRFANAVVTPRARGAVYEFIVAEDGEASRTYLVDGVIGGGHLEGGGTQGFLTRLGDGTLRFLPFDWSGPGHFWFCNTISRAEKGWVPITPALRLQDCGDWPPTRVLGDQSRYGNCQNCHASQLSVSFDTAAHRWNTAYNSLAINCESCHGPGSRHVETMGTANGARGADIGYAPLTTLSKDASIGVCYQCHAVKDHVRDGFLSGDSLTAFYSLKSPLLGDRPLYPDGRVRTFAYQEGQQYSDCYLNGGMTCTSCHDPHSQGYRTVTGAPLTGRFDDRQCTSCHASKAGSGRSAGEHSHHAAGSAGNRCTACHMPYLQHPETGNPGRPAVRYARSDHSISIPRPAADSALGIAGACVGCHAGRATADLERQVHAWWGELKPVKPLIAAQLLFSAELRASAPPSLAAAAPLLLGSAADSADDRHSYARFAGIARLLETYIKPDDPALDVAGVQRLEALATNPDGEVRAIALATLHLARGADPAVRRELGAALRRAGARDASLRARWTLALGSMGDRYASAGDLASALVAYRRALEISPLSAQLTLNLANAQRDAGDLDTAIESYRKGLEIDARQPLAWVNLGIALVTAGDTAGATDALNRAAALDPGEALAWFNLANIQLARGELDRAATLYSKSAALDPGIAVTHFRLARVWLLRKQFPAALRELRRGLAFDSTDAAAREAANALQKATRPGGR